MRADRERGGALLVDRSVPHTAVEDGEVDSRSGLSERIHKVFAPDVLLASAPLRLFDQPP